MSQFDNLRRTPQKDAEPPKPDAQSAAVEPNIEPAEPREEEITSYTVRLGEKQYTVQPDLKPGERLLSQKSWERFQKAGDPPFEVRGYTLKKPYSGSGPIVELHYLEMPSDTTPPEYRTSKSDDSITRAIKWSALYRDDTSLEKTGITDLSSYSLFDCRGCALIHASVQTPDGFIKPKETTLYNEDGQVMQRLTINHDASGLPVEKIFTVGDESRIAVRVAYEYDANRRISKKTTQEFKEDGTLYKETVEQYDNDRSMDDGNPDHASWFENTGTNHIITREKYVDGQPTEVQEYDNLFHPADNVPITDNCW